MNIVHFDLHKAIPMEHAITACIGYFDGLHIGHQKLIEEVLSISKENGTLSALITFEPDPWAVLKQLDAIPHITPMKQRMKLGEKLGIDIWIILHFDKEMAALPYETFHEQVLRKLNLHTLVCGYDFHYAAKGMGNTKTLKEQCDFAVSIISEVSSEHKKISSTRIETLLKDGDVEKAARFMGRFYDMEGHVKSGSKVGREHGFPTANLSLEELYVIPKKGVYIGAVHVRGKWHRAILNIGNNPTYNYQKQLSIEAHLLAFQDSIYGESVIFRFFNYIREEKKFRDAQELSAQLKQDVQTALVYFEGREELLLCD